MHSYWHSYLTKLCRRLDAQTKIEERKKQPEIAEARVKQQAEATKLTEAQRRAETEKLQTAEQAAVESRKRKEEKKKQREAQRKARRAAEKENIDPKVVDKSSMGSEAYSPACQPSPVDSMFHGGGFGVSKEDFPLGAKVTDTTEYGDNDGTTVCTDGTDEATQHVIHEPRTIVELSNSSRKIVLPNRGGDLKSGSSPGLLEEVRGPTHATSSIATKSKSISSTVGASESVAAISTTKNGRHRDRLQQFISAMKVDSAVRPMFTADHDAFKNTSGTCWWISECPYESSGTPDCPYHRTYCSCVDPTEQTTLQYIVHAESHPCEIGPFNYIQGEKLMEFFQSQPETKDKLMLIDEDLYTWLYTVGRHWRIETMTLKKLDNTPMPKRLSWEVEDYVRGFQKGRILKQVDQFQALADRNERIALIGCRTKVTEQLLQSLRKKCESGPVDEWICYCQDDIPNDPENDEGLVECMFRDCPIRFFHRRCVERLGYSKVTTWYCADCEKHISLVAQKALHGAHSISMKVPAPDFESGSLKAQMRIVAKQADVLLTGHCGKC